MCGTVKNVCGWHQCFGLVELIVALLTVLHMPVAFLTWQKHVMAQCGHICRILEHAQVCVTGTNASRSPFINVKKLEKPENYLTFC